MHPKYYITITLNFVLWKKEMNIVTAEVTNTSIGFYKLFELNNNMF